MLTDFQNSLNGDKN